MGSLSPSLFGRLISSGAPESGHVAFYQHFDPLDRGMGLRLELATC